MTSVYSRRRIITLFIALATMVALLAPTSALASHDSDRNAQRELTVMSRNLYLGADLTPAIGAPTPTDFIVAVANIYGSVEFTSFATRSEAIVDEISATRPDIIGLQEVSKWTVTVLGEVADPPDSYDFLQILLEDLKAAGLDYSVEAVSHNADLGPFPLAQCGPVEPPGCIVQFQDRDVILVADTPGLKVTGSSDGRYDTQFGVKILEGTDLEQTVSFNRGWAYIDGKYRGRGFRFVNTHLETEDVAPVQELQAAEFLAGPARKRGTVIAVGDFNSAADGSTTDSYRMLMERFRDSWGVNRSDPGPTCCSIAFWPIRLHN